MSKKIIKIVVLVLVFLAAVAGLSLFTNPKNVDLTSEMPEATLPVVCLKKGDTYINQLFGYKGEMNGVDIRDTITPLPENLVLPVSIQAFDNQIESISYEVRTLDMERLLEDTQISNFSQTAEGEITTEFNIQNLLEKDQEYLLIITLECNREKINYYTRVINAQEWYIDNAIAFSKDFHKKTFDKQAGKELATYLEPSSEGDNTTLQKVTIHSNLEQLTWGDFTGEVLMQPIPSIKEMSSSSSTIVMNYVVASTAANGGTEFYNVEEYYRLRYSTVNSRMYLLDFERTMNEIFRESGEHVDGSSLVLGIRDADVSYMANESATIISFVQEGDLWSYNIGTNQLSLVFSFRGIEGITSRNNHQDYDIRMIRVSESGSIDFVVYGYMNRGDYEGRTGIGVYHYDSIANTIQEQLFVESRESYQVLKETWGRLFYVSSKGYFYMIAEGGLYRIRLEDGKTDLMQSGLTEENAAASDGGRYMAWSDEKKGEITVMDLEDETRHQISGGKGEVLRPVGFVESDFVYGVGRSKEVSAGGQLLYRIVIADKNQKVIKEYEKSGYYITGAYVEDATVFLERAWKEGNMYVPVETDAIKSHEIEAARTIQAGTITTEEKQTQVALVTNQELTGKAPLVLTPKEVVLEKKLVVALDTTPQKGLYFVYARGNIVLCTHKIDEAVQRADKYAGVVIGEGQQYIWQRGRMSSRTMADKVILEPETEAGTPEVMARCLTALLQKENISFDVSGLVNAGESAERILREAMPEAQILNLTGCSVSQVLYYVNLGNLVFALGENQQPLLIAGYDERNIILYDPLTNTTYRQGLQDSEEFFKEAGNVFLSYR